MVRENQNNRKKKDILSASEIGQYIFCSIAWYLQRCGYKPDSPNLDIGKKTHINLGYVIDNIQNEMKRSRKYTLCGLILLTIAFFGFLFEVIL